MNYEDITRRMLLHARGQRSRAALSARMDMSSNVVWGWERARRMPRASLFFACLWACDIDVRSALERFFGAARPAWLRRLGPHEPFPTAALVEELKGRNTTVSFAALVGFDRFVVARWLAGETEPSFPKLLQLIDRGSSRLVDFVDALVPGADIAEVAELRVRLDLLRELAYAFPESEAILRVIEQGDARTRSIASQLPMLAPDRVAQALERMLADGVVRVDAQGLLELLYSQSVHTGRDPRRAAANQRFWGHTLVDTARDDEDVRSYVIFMANERELQALRREVREFYASLRRRIRTFRGTDHVVGASLVTAALASRGPRSVGARPQRAR